MLQKFFLTLGLIAVLGAADLAVAADDPQEGQDGFGRPYVKVGAGVVSYDKFKANNAYASKKPKLGSTFNLGVGRKITESLGTDLNFFYGEINYKANQRTQKSNTIGMMAGGYYDIKIISETKVPYLAAGAGFSRNNAGTLINNSSGSKTVYPGLDKTNFVWNVGAGIKFNIDKDYSLDLGYRYADLGKMKVGDGVSSTGTSAGGSSQRIKGHQGVLSLLYKF